MITPAALELFKTLAKDFPEYIPKNVPAKLPRAYGLLRHLIKSHELNVDNDWLDQNDENAKLLWIETTPDWEQCLELAGDNEQMNLAILSKVKGKGNMMSESQIGDLVEAVKEFESCLDALNEL